jgi:hypothetical protein
MIKTGLEFANGTSDDCKKLVGKLFDPGEILGAYREGRSTFRTSDVVLITQEENPNGFEVTPRLQYIAKLRAGMGSTAAKMMPVLTIAHKSAHQVTSLPLESDAMWLVILRREMVPVMVVIYATPYKVDGDDNESLVMS